MPNNQATSLPLLPLLKASPILLYAYECSLRRSRVSITFLSRNYFISHGKAIKRKEKSLVTFHKSLELKKNAAWNHFHISKNGRLILNNGTSGLNHFRGHLTLDFDGHFIPTVQIQLLSHTIYRVLEENFESFSSCSKYSKLLTFFCHLVTMSSKFFLSPYILEEVRM